MTVKEATVDYKKLHTILHGFAPLVLGVQCWKRLICVDLEVQEVRSAVTRIGYLLVVLQISRADPRCDARTEWDPLMLLLTRSDKLSPCQIHD